MRRYLIRFAQAVLFFLLSYSAHAQPVTLNGSTSVQPGDRVTYSVLSWPHQLEPGSSVNWTVLGGTIILSDDNSCMIQWGSNGLGYIGVDEALYSQHGQLNVQIGSPLVTVAPSPLSVDYGGTAQNLYATASDNYPVTQWVWQYSGSPSGPWTSIASTNNPVYTPSTTISQYYRCGATENGTVYYSSPAQVVFNPLDAGVIGLVLAPAFNTVPNITNTVSHGGLCLPGDRTYTWEQSIDGQPWTTIGTGVNYPSGNLIIGNTYIRRKVTCSGIMLSSNILYVVPTYTSVDFENLNYIRIIDVRVPGISTWQQADQLTQDSKTQGTTYTDGFGRPIQKVAKAASMYNGAWSDLVQPFVYDATGRPWQKMLPYPSIDNPGKFKITNVAAQQASFITGKFGEPAGAATYSSTEYDNSPLSRVMKVHAPGSSWSSVSVNNDYSFNDATENVHIWSLNYMSSAIPTSSSSAIYSTGTLYKFIVTDEKSKQVITYKDFYGNTVLKKVQEKESGAGLTGQHAGWACTYYVYDDLNQLRCIIPPKAVAYLDVNNWNLTQQTVDDLCFTYSFDADGRQVSKKQPGMARIDAVYDKENRPVFTQDGNGRSNNQWQGILYDGLGRTVATGVLQQSITVSDLQTYVDGHSGAVTITTTNTNLGSTGGVADLVVSGRVAGVREYVATNSININSSPAFISETNAQFSAYINSARIVSTNEIVAVADNPAPSGFVALTQQFYDNYSQLGAGRAYTNVDNALKDPATSSLATNLPAQPSPQTRGMATISKVKVISNPSDLTQGTWLETDKYFDDQGFVIQRQEDNYLGGIDIASNWIDFIGLPWGACVKHRAGTANQFTIVSRDVYDKHGKLMDAYKNFNNTFSKRLASYSYDEYSRLKNKILAPGYTGTGKGWMESLDYTYNIQGWLTGINKDYAINASTGQWDKFFGLYLGYDNRDSQFDLAQYNGNITGAIWRSQGDNSVRKYDYTYDNLGRFISGVFKQRKKPTDGWSQSDMNLSEYVTYADLNGNIATMKHLGAMPGMASGTIVDDLVYTYGSVSNNNVNKLSYVHENAALSGNGQLYDFKDGTNTESSTADYTYDASGNLTQDLNKGIAAGAIIYNYLNKPLIITIANKTKIEYMYDGMGVKLTKKVTDLSVTPNTSITTQYSNEFVYQDGVLQYVQHDEGRMKLITAQATGTLTLNAGTAGASNVITGKQGVFEYYLQDQLGNTRMVLTEEYQKEVYMATMETSDPTVKANEENLFGKVDVSGTPTADNELVATRVNKTSTPWTGNGSAQVTELTASLVTKKVGPNMIMKVSAGDLISATANYFYFANNTAGPTINVTDVLSPLIGALIGPAKGSPITKLNSSAIQSSLGATPVTGNFADFVNNQGSTGLPNAPKAFLNVIFFDEQFNFIPVDPTTPSTGTNLQRVSQENNQSATPLLLTQKAPKNGWVYIYLSNESNQSVYFDNLQVSQEHGRISEENHYYAFGQKISGISTKAFNKLSNPFNYQGDYSEEEGNTQWNEFDLRMYDPQIGKWTAADPYDEYASPYIGMGNDPVNNVDPDGGGVNGGTGIWSTPVGWGLISGAASALIEGLATKDKYQSATAFGLGFVGGFGAYFVNWNWVGSQMAGAYSWTVGLFRSHPGLVRLIFWGGASETPKHHAKSDNDTFKMAAKNVENDYQKDGDKRVTVKNLEVISSDNMSGTINEQNDNSVLSLDIITHGGFEGFFIYLNEDVNQNVSMYDGWPTWVAIGNNLVKGKGTIHDIDYEKFTDDAVIEIHGCKACAPHMFPLWDNIAQDLSEELYKAGKENAVVIGHTDRATAEINGRGKTKRSAQDYRFGERAVYYNGKLLFTTTQKGRITRKQINEYLKKLKKKK